MLDFSNASIYPERVLAPANGLWCLTDHQAESGGVGSSADPISLTEEGKMGNKTDIWMPLYIGDYLADTGHLTAAEHGCYLLWLMHYWRNGPLEDDIPQLLRIGKLDISDAEKVARKLLKNFFILGRDRLWRQKRQEEERAKWLVKKVSAQEKARKAATKRWDATSNASSMLQAMPGAMLEPCPSPLPLPVPLPKPKPSTKGIPVTGAIEANGRAFGQDLQPLSSFIHKVAPPPKALPQNKTGAMQAGYTFSNKAACRICGEQVEWWTSPGGTPTPFLAETGALHLGSCAAQAKAQ